MACCSGNSNAWHACRPVTAILRLKYLNSMQPLCFFFTASLYTLMQSFKQVAVHLMKSCLLFLKPACLSSWIDRHALSDLTAGGWVDCFPRAARWQCRGVPHLQVCHAGRGGSLSWSVGVDASMVWGGCYVQGVTVPFLCTGRRVSLRGSSLAWGGRMCCVHVRAFTWWNSKLQTSNRHNCIGT